MVSCSDRGGLPFTAEQNSVSSAEGRQQKDFNFQQIIIINITVVFNIIFTPLSLFFLTLSNWHFIKIQAAARKSATVQAPWDPSWKLLMGSHTFKYLNTIKADLC